MSKIPHGEPYAGKLHVRFDEGADVPCGGVSPYSTPQWYENLDRNPSDDDAKRMNNLYRVRITVTWGQRGQGRGKKEQESYVTLWRKP